MMQVSKKIPFEDPNVLMGVRALYVVSNLLIAGIYFYTKMQIDKKRGMHIVNATIRSRDNTNTFLFPQT